MNEFRDLRKVELHLHLEGAAPPEFIRRLAAEKNVDLSGLFDAEGNYDWADFAAFLKTYEAACSVLRGPDDFRRLTEAVLAESAANGVIYTEIFLAPDFCGGGDAVAWREYLDAIVAGARAAQAASGIETRFIPTCVRHFGPERARIIAKLVADTPDPMVSGFGMGGEERHLRAADFAPAFDVAREAGLSLTSHAGEICGADSVRETLDALAVSRIGHGVRAVEDAALVDRLAAEGVVLEVNPGSNISLSVFGNWAAHPVARLRDAGVKITVSTDDPPYFATDMTREYMMLARTFGWGEAEFLGINQTAIRAAFCDTATKRKISDKLKEKVPA